MALTKICPVCPLENPPTAQRCDCGWDFEQQKMAASLVSAEERKTFEPAESPVKIILTWIMGGCLALEAINLAVQLYKKFSGE